MQFVRIRQSILRGTEVEVEEAGIFSAVSVLIGDTSKFRGEFQKCGLVVIRGFIDPRGLHVVASGYIGLHERRIFPITLPCEQLLIKVVKWESIGEQNLLIEGTTDPVIPGIFSEDNLTF